MNDPGQFGALLERYRNKMRWSLRDLSMLTGVKHRTLDNWEKGAKPQRRRQEQIIKLASVLYLNESEANDFFRSAGLATIEKIVDDATRSQNQKLLEVTRPWMDALRKRQENIPFQVPSDIASFVGRKAWLRRLEQILLAPLHKTVCAIEGMGGVGKTSLAIRIAYQVQRYFPDGVLWARLDTSDTMTTLYSFGSALGYDLTNYTDLESRSRMMRQLLAQKRVLMVLDNVSTNIEMEPLLPATGHCAVLITSRNRLGTKNLTPIMLEPFESNGKECLDLFTAFLGHQRVKQEKTGLLEIGRIVGQLPLAIAIVAGRLGSEPNWTVLEFLERLKQQKRPLDELQHLDDNIRKTFSVSFERLSPDDKEFFISLGVFFGEDFGVEASAYIASLDAAITQAKLRTVFMLNLVQQGGKERYRLHPVLRDYARDKIKTSLLYERMVNFFVNYIEAHRFDFVALDLEIGNILGAFEKAYGLALGD